jgi:hypothetical protein
MGHLADAKGPNIVAAKTDSLLAHPIGNGC